MGKYFGTDGARGIANEELDCSIAFGIGQAAATVLAEECAHRAVIYVGKDTRVSSDMLEAALVAGVTSAGADAVLLGVAPTPAVAHLVKENADAGIMISASHNPFEYNGIKLFSGGGYKLSDATEARVERLMDEGVKLKTGAEIGRVRNAHDLLEIYEENLLSAVSGDVAGLNILIDCANGAAAATAPALFRRLPLACCDFMSVSPDGININAKCGSTDLAALCAAVREGGYDAGIAFDGDADRCLMVDERGAPLNGDIMLALLAREERRLGRLNGDTLVATVMSNFGLSVWAREQGIKLRAAAVGDRYVLEDMLAGDYSLGGENSGHVIFLRHSTTGDGQLTALKLLSLLGSSGAKLSELAGAVTLYPQVLLNVGVSAANRAAAASHPDVLRAVARAEDALGGAGRVLVRPSGTENLVRVMIEGRDKQEIESLAASVADVIRGL
ncbi:MAG: phosphoglucosamine mutase [Oscillospiraceae bacterium]|jgi:phosphoglucosamine mutase|nr:phosphoglucosamine mutase [Oscillospiraceae bacterium]